MKESDPQFGREVDRFILGSGFWGEEEGMDEQLEVARAGSLPVGSTFDMDVRRRCDTGRTVARAILEVAESLEVHDQEDYSLAVEVGKNIKRAIKGIKEDKDDALKPAKLMLRDYELMFQQITDPLEAGERSIKRKLLIYQELQDANRRMEDLKAREEAAARQRQLNEEAEARAMAAAEKGDMDLAHRIETSVPVVVTEAPAPAPAAAGSAIREEWKYEIVNPEIIPKEYWILDEKAIGKVVRAMKDKTNIPGVRAYPEKNISLYSGR